MTGSEQNINELPTTLRFGILNRITAVAQFAMVLARNGRSDMLHAITRVRKQRKSAKHCKHMDTAFGFAGVALRT